MAGGFFSGGSSDAVNASVAEAEAAAREAEAARDEINNKFVEFAGQTEGGDYTVPNADDALTTKFLNQVGDWVVPAAGTSAEELDDLTDVTLSNPTSNQFLRYNSVSNQWVNQSVSLSAGINAGAGLDIDNNTDTISIEDEGVVTVMLADGNVTTAKIADVGVTTAKIADAAVDAAKLSDTGTDGQLLSTNADGDLEWIDAAAGISYSASDGITLSDDDDFSLADSGVTTAKLAEDAVTDAKLADDAVTTSKILDANVTDAKLADNAVTTDKILDANVTVDKIADNAVTTVKILDANVTVDKIADDAITTNKIADANVTNDKIAIGTIDETKLDITNTGTAGQVLSLHNVDDQFTWIDAADALVYTGAEGVEVTGTEISIEDGGVTTAKIADANVTTAKIADDAIDATKLSVAGTDGQLLATDSDGNLEWVTPAEGTAYTASDGITLTGVDFTLTDGGVTTAKVADNAIDATKLSVAGTTDQILSTNSDGDLEWVDEAAAAAYTAGTGLSLTGLEFSVADGGIDTTQIAGDAVDGSKLDATNTPTAGQFLTANLDNSFTWVTPAAGTAYTAGTGLDLTGDEFSIADDGVDTAQLADNAVDADKLNVTGNGTSGQFLASDGDGSFTWTASTNSLEGLTDTNIPASITNRRFLEYNTDTNLWDAVAATEFLNLSELFDVDITNVANNQFLRYNSTDDRWENETITIPANLTFNSPLSRSGTTVSLPDGSIDVDLLADNAVDADKLSVSGTSGQILSTNSSGDLAWIDADGNTAYTAGTGLTLTGDEFSVTPNGITNALLANNSVRTENIADGTITGADMADGTVGNTQIADDAVTAAKIADNTITAAQVASNSLGATELATDSVSSFKLQDDAVISGKIANNVVGADELDVSGNGDSGQFLTSDGDGTFSWTTSSGGVTYTAGTGLDLSDTNVFSVPNDGITSALIATNAVGTDQIADNAVTGTQLADGSVGTTELESDAVTNAKLADNAVDTSEIASGAVTTAKIATGAVMSASLGSNAVTTVKIIDAAVTSGKLATDIPISTFSDVNTTGVNNGQILTYNGTTWVPTNNSGGGNTDNSRLGITLSPTSLNEGDEATSISVELDIVNMISDETISGQSVTVTDPTGHSVAVTGSGNSFTFMASTANSGNFVVRASATFTTGGTSTVHSASANLPVHATDTNWYQWVTDTQPTAITSTDVVDNGVFSSPETGTWTRPTEDTDSSEMAYVALPTGTYTFRLGLLFADIDDLGVISTNYTLYRINDFAEIVPGGDRIVTITEA